MNNERKPSQNNKQHWQILGLVLLMVAVLVFNFVSLYTEAAPQDMIIKIAKIIQNLGNLLFFLGFGLLSLKGSKTGNSMKRAFQENQNIRIATWIGGILYILAITFRFLYSLLLIGGT